MQLDPWKCQMESSNSRAFYNLIIGFQIMQFDP